MVDIVSSPEFGTLAIPVAKKKEKSGAKSSLPNATAKAPGRTSVNPRRKGLPSKKASVEKKDLAESQLKAQAACLIQRRVRSFLQRRHREKQQEIERSERLLQEEMMKMQQEAWIARLNLIRKQDERKQRIAEEKRREQKERKAREVKFMEAAYDGEDSIVMELIAGNSDKSIPPVFVDCRSMGDGDTALSEASVAGNYSTCLALLNAGADPDVPGRFHRSPLWRAAFMSHAPVVELLLENGADPRIGDDEGRLPRHVTQDKECLEAIDTYDVEDVRAAFVQVRAETLLKRQMEVASEQEANMKELLCTIQECASSFYDAHSKLSVAIQSEALEQAAVLRSDIEGWEEKWRIAKEEARELIERLGGGGGGVHRRRCVGVCVHTVLYGRH